MANMIYRANFGIIDDHTLLSTLHLGANIPPSIMPEIGRFFPLNAFDLNIISKFFGINASAFYAFSALGALVLIICLYRTLNYYLNSLLSMLIITAFLCTPAFITAFLRLFVPEKFESIFFGIFLICYIYFLRQNSKFSALIAIISATIALYYKEPAFIMLGGFAFFHFIFSFKTSTLWQKILDILLCISAFIWIVAYYFIVIANKSTSGNYGDTPYNQLIVFAKISLNYLLTEPFLFIGVFGVVAYRIYLVVYKKEQINALLDALLLGAMLYLLAYLVLKIYSFHYPLPAYIFALLPLGYYFYAYFRAKFVKIIFYICIILYVLNALPSFLYQLNHYKAVPNNFATTISFLGNYLSQNPTTNIYLEGVNRASGVEVYHSFAKNLVHLGHSEFDLLSDIGVDNILLGKSDADSAYSVFKSNAMVEKKSGDLVVLTPFNTREFKGAESYELLFTSTQGFNLPLLNIKSMLKIIALKFVGENSEVILASNVYALPIHFSVYRVK
ncbi:hypothetical protein ACWIUD_05215 [Helicobacter sp. 23-1044]